MRVLRASTSCDTSLTILALSLGDSVVNHLARRYWREEKSVSRPPWIIEDIEGLNAIGRVVDSDRSNWEQRGATGSNAPPSPDGTAESSSYKVRVSVSPTPTSAAAEAWTHWIAIVTALSLSHHRARAADAGGGRRDAVRIELRLVYVRYGLAEGLQVGDEAVARASGQREPGTGQEQLEVLYI